MRTSYLSLIVLPLVVACGAVQAPSGPAPSTSTPAPSAQAVGRAPAGEASAAVAAAPAAEKAAACRWVESEYGDSVTVSTCDAVAHIQVRFLSFGPGFCTVEARTGVQGDAVSVAAPPGVFTGWINLPVAHLGPVTRTITNRVHCDTGVRSQVRYSAPR